MPSLFPTLVLVSVLVGLVAGVTTGRALLRWWLFAATGFVVVVWLPIIAAGVLDPEGVVVGNALGLGLLAWGGSVLGIAALSFGVLLRIVELFASLRR